MDRKYFVNFKVESNLIHANITFIESITNNKVYAVYFPNYTQVLQFEIDKIPYELSYNYRTGKNKIVDLTTLKCVRSKKQKKYLLEIANYIIEEGNQYLKNTFGNVKKLVNKLSEEV